MYVCSYAGSEKPHSGGNIFSDPNAVATNLPRVEGYIYGIT